MRIDQNYENGGTSLSMFCGMTNFHRFKFGFDRTLWINEIPDSRHAEVCEIAIESQRAALEVLVPGIKTENIHVAYSQVIKDAGFDYPFRCERATAYSFLENSQPVTGDKTMQIKYSFGC